MEQQVEQEEEEQQKVEEQIELLIIGNHLEYEKKFCKELFGLNISFHCTGV